MFWRTMPLISSKTTFSVVGNNLLDSSFDGLPIAVPACGGSYIESPKQCWGGDGLKRCFNDGATTIGLCDECLKNYQSA